MSNPSRQKPAGKPDEDNAGAVAAAEERTVPDSTMVARAVEASIEAEKILEPLIAEKTEAGLTPGQAVQVIRDQAAYDERVQMGYHPRHQRYREAAKKGK